MFPVTLITLPREGALLFRSCLIPCRRLRGVLGLVCCLVRGDMPLPSVSMLGEVATGLALVLLSFALAGNQPKRRCPRHGREFVVLAGNWLKPFLPTVPLLQAVFPETAVAEAVDSTARNVAGMTKPDCWRRRSTWRFAPRGLQRPYRQRVKFTLNPNPAQVEENRAHLPRI